MKNIFGKKEVFSIRKLSMGAASVMIAASLLVSTQTNLHVLKAKENIEVQVNKEIKVSIIEKNGGAEVELTATKDLIDVDINVMLNGTRVTSYHIASIKAGEKIQKEVTKDQLEAIKQLIANGQKTLPNTAVVEKNVSQTINIAGNNLRVDVKYHVEEELISVKPEQPKPEVKPEQPKPGVKPGQPEVKPEQPKPEEKPGHPEVTPNKPEIKPEQPKPEVKPGQPEVKPEQPKPEEKPGHPEVTPNKPEIKPEQPKPEEKPEQPKPEEKPEQPKPEEKPGHPEVTPNKPEVKPEQPKPEVKPEQPKPEKTNEQNKPEKKEENKVVKFEDANLKRILLKKLKDYKGVDEEDDGLAGEFNIKIKDKSYRKDKNDTEIYEKDMEQLESFAIRGFDEETFESFVGDQQIKSIVGLEKAVNLKQLTISGNPDDSRGAVRDISPLRGLKNLELLRLSHNDIIDISPVAGLTNLKHLFLSHNQIKKIDAVKNLTNLESLDFARNMGEERISDISPIANLTKLKLLGLSDANIPDISILKNLVNLETFMANDSKIEDISVLKNARNLRLLYVEKNKISDVSVVKDLVNLEELYLRHNSISEIDFSKLTKLRDVSVEDNKIRDYSSLEKLSALEQVNLSKQNVDLNKEYALDGNSVEIDMPIIGIKSHAKEGTLKVTSDNDKVKASYDEKTNKVALSVTDEVMKEFSNKQLVVNLKVLYVDKQDYKAEETNIDVKNIKLNVKSVDTSNKSLRDKLGKLTSRELRNEKGYVANEGNQPANNAWIVAKTEAEKVLKNSNATKEQLEAAISNLTEKTNAAIVGSEKTKVKKLIVSSNKDNEDKLKLRAELSRAKTIEEVNAVAEKVGGKVTPPSGNNTETKPEKPEGSNPGTTPEKPEVPGETKPDNPKNESTPEKPKTEDGNIVAIKEAIVTKNLQGKGGLLLFDVEVKNTDVNKVGLVAYRDGVKTENVTIDKFLTESTNKVSYTITVPKNETDKEVKYKFVVTVDGVETNKYLEKMQEVFAEEAKISNYSLENEVLQGGGEGILVLKGNNLTTSNVKIRVFNADSVEENTILTNNVVYEKRNNDLVARINFPENTTNTSKSYKVKIYQNGKEVNITTLEGRDRRDKPTFTVVAKDQDSTKPVLSNLTITSYRTSGTGAVNDGIEKTETTVASNQVSKKTEVHLYGANLNEVKTKVKIVDQNGVEWPIEGAESDLIKMVLAGKSGVNNGILGNGTFQIAEIILPGNLKENMKFTYTFAVDGTNFDTTHKVHAIVEKTGGQVDPVVKTITLKYQDETGKKIAEDKVLKAYSHFPVSVGKADLPGYIFVKVKDISALNDRIGEKTEITYVYKNSNGDSMTTEKPKVQDSNNGTQPEVNEDVKKLKEQLQNLVAKDLRTESNYKMQGTGEETAWLNSRKNAEKTLTKVDVEKTELELRIKKLTNAIETLKVANAQKNSNSPEIIPPNNNSTSMTEELEEVKKEAKSKVLNSEFIQDKTKYFERIKEATTVEVLKALISEIDKLNSNEGKESTVEENITESAEQLKAKLQTLVDNNLLRNEKYAQASPDLKKEYRQARALATKLLNEDATKEQLKEQITVLETVTKKILG